MIFSMPWTEAQRKRLAVEKNILDHYFPGCVKWLDPTNHNLKVEVTLKTNNDNKYTLRIYVGNFPNSVPDMVVVSSPKPMPDWGESYENHTLSKRDGYLRIWHSRDSKWTENCTLYLVIMKGKVWLEAYERHIRAGQTMNYLVKMDRRGSEVNEPHLADWFQPSDRNHCLLS